MQHEAITAEIIDAAIKVHKTLGPGLLESAYEKCLIYELRSRGLLVESQVDVPIRYMGQEIAAGYRIDLLVERAVVVEVKTVEKLNALHEAQLLSQLRMKELRVGLLINFHVRYLKDGIKRMVNGWDPAAED